MKFGSCIHLEELRSTQCSMLRRPTFYGSLTFIEFLHLGHFLRNYKGWSHETWAMNTSGRVKDNPMFNFET